MEVHHRTSHAKKLELVKWSIFVIHVQGLQNMVFVFKNPPICLLTLCKILLCIFGLKYHTYSYACETHTCVYIYDMARFRVSRHCRHPQYLRHFIKSHEKITVFDIIFGCSILSPIGDCANGEAGAFGTRQSGGRRIFWELGLGSGENRFMLVYYK